MIERPVARYRPSPRTNALPMAFTGREFFHGALTAWGCFLALVPPVTLIYLIMISTLNPASLPKYMTEFPAAIALFAIAVLSALVVIVPWSIAGFLVGAPLAYGLGLSLRRIESRAIHVVAFTFLGLVVGVAASTVGAVVSTGPAEVASPIVLGAIALYSAVASLAVVLGWIVAVTTAWRADAQVDRGT